ncbi:MAG: hypothetical protein JJT76_19280 [Clostridiaceae bacterium]|nr:hypothetical protein [Clostridiaceae bacterium]
MKNIIRITLYILGLFFLATGVTLAVKSNLGVSPVSAIPLAISNVSGISLGNVSTGMFTFYVLMQVLVLGRNFKPKNLLQIGFGFIFGYFVDMTAILLHWVDAPNYLSQILLIFISCFAIAVALMLIITMDIVPSAPEGFVLSLTQVTKHPFAKLKVWLDCTSVALAAIISLLFIGNISGIREGTIISALLIGKVIGLISIPCKPVLQRLAFNDKEEVPQVTTQ